MVPVLLQVLKLELKEIRAQQDLLFRFMSFLKQEGAVHVLQFCLTVGKPLPPTHSTPRSFPSNHSGVSMSSRGVQRADPVSRVEPGGAAAAAH